MSTIKNLQVKTNLNTSCDLLVVGAQDGASKFLPWIVYLHYQESQ